MQASTEGYSRGEGGRRAPSQDTPHRVEVFAREQLAAAIASASLGYPLSEHGALPLDDRWGCVISLNFDIAWHHEPSSNAQPSALKRSGWNSEHLPHLENVRLSGSVASVGQKKARLWFPNGSVLRPSTVRMGLNDYGISAFGIKTAFNAAKRWERVNLRGADAKDANSFRKIRAALRQASEDPTYTTQQALDGFPLTWVSELLYRPLIIAGAGLSHDEAGLWWLLSQRARNTARVCTAISQATFILVHESDRPAFWRTRPFGIEPITCANWDEGWERIMGLGLNPEDSC
jgi:hypothetical protein